MLNEQQADELLSVLSRIAHSLEKLSSVVDGDEKEFNVYCRGEVSLEGEDDEEEEEEYDED